jgi:hypothetical protein
MLRTSLNRLGIAATVAAIVVLGAVTVAAQDRYALAVPDGLAFSEFQGYDTWQVVSVSQHTGIIDVVLGNPAAIEAYKSGAPANGKAFPDGAKLAKIHWNSKKLSAAFPVEAPDTLHDVEFMLRDSARFKDADHWAYAEFTYDTASRMFSPAGKGPGCGAACHQAAASRDFVFTEYPAR